MTIRPTCNVMIIVAIIIMLLNSQHSPSCDVKSSYLREIRMLSILIGVLISNYS